MTADAYEKLQALTHGKPLDKAGYRQFVLELNLPADERERLLNLSPGAYIGLARALALLPDESAESES